MFPTLGENRLIVARERIQWRAQCAFLALVLEHERAGYLVAYSSRCAKSPVLMTRAHTEQFGKMECARSTGRPNYLHGHTSELAWPSLPTATRYATFALSSHGCSRSSL